MIDKSESYIERKVVDWVREYARSEVITYKLEGTGHNGVPDRLFLFDNGRCFFIEFKAPGEVPSLLQTAEHKRLRKLGHDIEVYDDEYDAIRALKKRMETSPVPEESR